MSEYNIQHHITCENAPQISASADIHCLDQMPEMHIHNHSVLHPLHSQHIIM